MPSCRLQVKVTPNASADRVGPWKGDELQMRVRAPAVDGRANEALCELLAAHLGLHSRAVTVFRGGTSRHKLVDIQGLDLPSARARLLLP
ncbi:MAG: DUF167 domain-containing protein [Opitutaceae bacterium]|jgi:uncharacterized protein (TIGR00251 family)